MPPREATIRFDTDVEFVNKHLTESMNCRRAYHVRKPMPKDTTLVLEDMGAVAQAFEKIIGDAIAAGAKLRPAGGAWSLSPVAFSGDWFLDTMSLNLKWKMLRDHVRNDYQKDFDKLYLFQCGNSIQEVNDTLEADGNSLSTCGASNGQTIAGAISTCTHGSAFQFGSMTEYVVGIHLVIGPGKTIWLERASNPIVTDAFLAKLDAPVVRDTDMFNAVLVSFGSFGLIAGLLIESEAKYELSVVQQRMSLTADLRQVMNTLQTTLVNLPQPNKVPWHFEITFNPHDIGGGGYVRTMYKTPFDNTRPPNPPLPSGSTGPGEGLLSVINTLTAVGGPALIASAINLLLKKNMNLNPTPFIGACSEVFTTTFLRGKAMSMELGIAMENSTRVLDLILSLTPELDYYAGVISYRWVKQGTAMLGWTKFPITATIEFNAASNQRTMALYRRIWSELQTRGIDFTLHWGQMSEFTPALIQKMYGNKVTQWKNCRDQLMPATSRSVFTNDFMIKCGLD
ncbi:MAG TPA: FAD-binding protein [Cyclobacteriaceae bacterium]|nr:FAD-binding protein [Cyclobacteriaceae bacterium]